MAHFDIELKVDLGRLKLTKNSIPIRPTRDPSFRPKISYIEIVEHETKTSQDHIVKAIIPWLTSWQYQLRWPVKKDYGGCAGCGDNAFIHVKVDETATVPPANTMHRSMESRSMVIAGPERS